MIHKSIRSFEQLTWTAANSSRLSRLSFFDEEILHVAVFHVRRAGIGQFALGANGPEFFLELHAEVGGVYCRTKRANELKDSAQLDKTDFRM
jgi:hypothetical protein